MELRPLGGLESCCVAQKQKKRKNRKRKKTGAIGKKRSKDSALQNPYGGGDKDGWEIKEEASQEKEERRIVMLSV